MMKELLLKRRFCSWDQNRDQMNQPITDKPRLSMFHEKGFFYY
jgi:hypothetical protein